MTIINTIKRILNHIKNNDIIYGFLAPMLILMIAWQVLLILDFKGYIT
jgi:hypothetical protein